MSAGPEPLADRELPSLATHLGGREGVVAGNKKWYQSVVPDDATSPREINASVPHIARIYDYWLGGKDNFAVDREAAQHAVAGDPDILPGVRGNRAFLARTVRYLAAEAGIRQFLDIGTGIPSASNTHEVAQAAAPRSRVVYVDNDPIVLAHARALLNSTAGPTAYLDADARDTERIVAEAAATLDFGQPIAVMMIGLLHCLPGDEPYQVVTGTMASVPSGSYLAISHPGRDLSREAEARLNQMMPSRVTFRTRDEVGRFFAGLDLVEPGLVRIPDWRPDSDADRANPAAMWGGVAKKP